MARRAEISRPDLPPGIGLAWLFFYCVIICSGCGWQGPITSSHLSAQEPPGELKLNPVIITDRQLRLSFRWPGPDQPAIRVHFGTKYLAAKRMWHRVLWNQEGERDPDALDCYFPVSGSSTPAPRFVERIANGWLDPYHAILRWLGEIYATYAGLNTLYNGRRWDSLSFQQSEPVKQAYCALLSLASNKKGILLVARD